MAQTLGWDLFFDRAKAEIESHQRSIMAGNLSAEDYRKESGWIQGALAVLNLPNKMRDDFQRKHAQYEEEQREAAEDVEGYAASI
jgi:hypothetical protein